MKKNVIETVLGAVVLAVAFIFLSFSYSSEGVGKSNGYNVKARFSSIGGLNVGDKVVVSGVRVGSVSEITLDKETFLAIVSMDVDSALKLPDDTAAFISSESLMGGLYLQLEPGASEDIIEAGDFIQYTQAPQNLEQLLGQFIFSMQGDDEDKK